MTLDRFDLMPAGTTRHIVFAASLAQRPGVGGHAWVILQYLLGFRRLGYRVLFLDSLQPGMCVDSAGGTTTLADSWNLAYFRDVMTRFGLADDFSLSYHGGEQTLGVSRADAIDRIRSADMLINVMGYLDDSELLSAAKKRVFLDIDPGFGQMWRDLGWADLFEGHDRFVTIGLNIGLPDCLVPTCGLEWIPTLQPVVLEHWPVAELPPPGRRRFTSVISWRGPFGPIDYQGKRYGLRCHEFRKFVSLPNSTGETFELAIDLHPKEVEDIRLLDSHHWSRVDPYFLAGTTEQYQGYIQSSFAELMIAKNLYVETRGGWFSDRTICYLASGRPALVQETGLSAHLPIGEGLITFRDLVEAEDGVRRIADDPARHALRAREIAEDYFDSDRVLTRLLERL